MTILKKKKKDKFPKKLTFEAGMKSALQKFDSQTDFFNIILPPLSNLLNTNRIPDPSRTNKYEFREGIHAGYVQGSKTFGDFILKVGIRGESTNMRGRQLFGQDTTFKITRFDYFPYIYLSRKIMKIAGYELRGFLISRRSISRPVYENLNPSVKVIDQYLYEVGNPALRPQFTQTYEANISVDNMPIFAFGKNFTRDIFSNVVYQDPKTPSIAVRTYDNLGTNEETYFRLLGAIPPGKAYFFVLGTQFGLNKYNGVYENTPLNFSRGTWSFFTFHQYKINKNTTAQLNGFLRTKGQLQFYELSNFGNLNLSLNRVFLDRKLTVTASLNDVFYTNRNTFTLNQGSISAVGNRRADTRRFGLNLRYNFGRKKHDEGSNPFNFETLEKASN
ncbi:MAG: outer membrane beta-barrel family protein [Emticicia sp.]|nr:outer membrane beta-barrel family protein [Emticicia sp.]